MVSGNEEPVCRERFCHHSLTHSVGGRSRRWNHRPQIPTDKFVISWRNTIWWVNQNGWITNWLFRNRELVKKIEKMKLMRILFIFDCWMTTYTESGSFAALLRSNYRPIYNATIILSRPDPIHPFLKKEN